MGDRLISADALQEWVRNYLSVFKKYDWRDILQIIRNQPVVDAEPVRHGRWEWNDYGGFGNYHCSECRYIPYGKFPWNHRPDYMYCPNCGAKMDGGKDG